MMAAALSATILAAASAADAGGPGAAPNADPPWLLLAAVAAVIVLTVAALAYLAKYLRLAVNLFLETPLPVTAHLHDYTLPQGEVVTFPSLEGRSLRGMFVERPPGTPDRGTVVFCHEFASDMMSAGRYASGLVQAGYTVFTFDFRGHGASFTPPHFEARHWPSNHDVHDIQAAIAYVKSRRDLGSQGLGILGVSRGASAAVIAAAISPDIRCLVVDGLFSTDLSIDGLMTRWVQIFTGIDLTWAARSMSIYRLFRALTMFYVELKCRCRFPSTRRALARLDTVPILFIHGERDTYVPPEQTRVLHHLKPGPKDLWVCPGAKHNQAVATDPATYHRKVVEFLDRYLGAAAPAAARTAAE